MPVDQINQTMLHYETFGEGPPIVFIHPPILTSANFQFQLQLRSEFQIITFDIRGHGRSHRSEQPITYKLIVEDIIHLLDHLSIEQAFLCGYSTGGSIVLEAILNYPERIRGGILVSAMSQSSDLLLNSLIGLATRLSRGPMIRLLRRVIAAGNAIGEQNYLHLLQDSQLGSFENIHQYYEYSLHYNCTAQLPQIQTPTLLAFGEQDIRFHRYRQILQNGLPQYTLVTIPGQKHQLPTKAYPQLNAHIRTWVLQEENRKPHQNGLDHKFLHDPNLPD